MTTELAYLALSIGLGTLQIIAASHAASRVRGYAWSASPRDAVLPPLPGVAGRLARAVTNFGETFPLFVAAVVLVTQTGRASELSAVGAAMYFWARLGFVLLYVLGVPVVRSLVWNAALVGIGLIVWQALGA
jgi:uncharacterized MAPEG superfamily protein